MLLPSNFNLIIITLFVCLINITSQLTDLLMKLLVHSHHAANSLPLCGFMRKLLLFYNPPGRVLQTCWPAALRWPCCNRSLCFHLFYHNEVSRWLEQACLWSLTDTGHTCTCVCVHQSSYFLIRQQQTCLSWWWLSIGGTHCILMLMHADFLTAHNKNYRNNMYCFVSLTKGHSFAVNCDVMM